MSENLLEKIRQASLQEPKTIQQQFLKLMEELGEACQAYLSAAQASGNRYKNLNQEDLKEELADIMLVTMAILYKLDTTDEELMALLARKTEKWVEKQEY